MMRDHEEHDDTDVRTETTVATESTFIKIIRLRPDETELKAS